MIYVRSKEEQGRKAAKNTARANDRSMDVDELAIEKSYSHALREKQDTMK